MLVLGACSRRDEQTTVTGAQLEASVSTTPREAELNDAAKRWNQAMSQRDLSLLAGVYGVRVTFYGVPLRHDQVLQVLSDAFTKDPSFTQSIDDVRTGNGTRVRMKRTWVTLGAQHSETTWLQLAREDGKLVVVGQGDDKPEGPKIGRCEDLAQRVVLSTPRATSMMHAQANGYPNESRVVATPPEWPMYVVTIIDRTTPHPIAIGWFDVVPETGEVSDAFTGETLTPNRDLIAQMRTCKP